MAKSEMKRHLTIKELPEEERPRERLLKFGAENLSPVELLAIILRTGYQSSTARILAKECLLKFGSLQTMTKVEPEELMSVKGIGKAKAAQIQAALELGRRSTVLKDFELWQKSYKEYIDHEKQRELGQFYTPPEVVSYILDQVGYTIDCNIEEKKILDPACGQGVFLLEAEKRLVQKLKRLNFSPEVILQKLQENIYGFDIDPFNCYLTQQNLLSPIINLIRKVQKNNPNFRVKRFNISATDFLKESTKQRKTVQMKLRLPTLVKESISGYMEEPETIKKIRSIAAEFESDFDFTVGNPPYVTIAKKDISDNIYDDIICGSINTASLFLKKATQFLPKTGQLGFLLPKSMLRVDSYRKIRNYILDNLRVKRIADCGMLFPDVRGEQFVLVLEKETTSIYSENYPIPIDKFSLKPRDIIDIQTHYTDKLFLRTCNTWPIYTDAAYQKIFTKISENSKLLGYYCDINRGISIGGNSPLIHTAKLAATDEEVLRGNCIGKFEIRNILWLDKKGYEQQLARIDRLKNKKIVLQNIFSRESGILGTYDSKGLVTLDTVTNILLKASLQIDLRYILALLNSELIHFFLVQFVYCQSYLTMHTDKPYLSRLPVKILSHEKQIEFINIVDKILDQKILLQKNVKTQTIEKVKQLKKDIEQTMHQLDIMVYRLYGLSNHEIQLIKKSIKR